MVTLTSEYSNLSNIPAVYIFKNIINGKFYIGETINLKKRMEEYLYPSRKKVDRIIHHAIRKYGIDNFSFEFYYFQNFKKKDLLDMEEAMILRFNSLKPNGYNLCVKGTDCTGFKHSVETRAKMSKSKSKEIHQYDALSGKYLKSYISVDEAAKEVGGNSPNLSLSASGIRKSSNGFIWSYDKLNSVTPFEDIGVTKGKTILQHSLDGKLLNKFSSLREAASYVGGNHNNICNNCNRKTKKSYGYVWSYA
jgi:group I intron endonuclease